MLQMARLAKTCEILDFLIILSQIDLHSCVPLIWFNFNPILSGYKSENISCFCLIPRGIQVPTIKVESSRQIETDLLLCRTTR